jgi:hypothetical protein
MRPGIHHRDRGPATEYLVAENRILKTQLQRRLRLSDPKPRRDRSSIGPRGCERGGAPPLPDTIWDGTEKSSHVNSMDPEHAKPRGRP